MGMLSEEQKDLPRCYCNPSNKKASGPMVLNKERKEEIDSLDNMDAKKENKNPRNSELSWTKGGRI
jgi:hypothetical protein